MAQLTTETTEDSQTLTTDDTGAVAEEANQDEGKVMTQKEIDEIVEGRLERASKQHQKDVQAKYGHVDLEAYAIYEKQEEAKLTYAERQTNEMQSKDNRITALETAETALKSRLETMVIDNTIKQVCQSNNILNSDIVLAMLKPLITVDHETGKTTVKDESGNVRANKKTGQDLTIEEAIDEFAELHPGFKPPTPSGNGTFGNTSSSTHVESRLPQQRNRTPGPI